MSFAVCPTEQSGGNSGRPFWSGALALTDPMATDSAGKEGNLGAANAQLMIKCVCVCESVAGVGVEGTVRGENNNEVVHNTQSKWWNRVCKPLIHPHSRSNTVLFFYFLQEYIYMLYCYVKPHLFILYCSVLQHCILPLFETLCFSSCLFKDPPPLPEYQVCSHWSADTRLSQRR